MTLATELLTRVGSLWNLYGPTETTIWTTMEQVGEHSFGATISVGRPVANARVYILDQKLEPMPVGVPGELCIGGAGVARGYLGQAKLSAQCFVDDPFDPEPGARLYRSGDLARWRADGRLEYLGRMDFQLKIRGYRVEPGEVEASLEQHRGVDQAVVTASAVSGIAVLVAYVVGKLHDARQLDVHLRARLPAFMVPSAWVFLDRLPLLPNGKVNRRALPEPEGTGLRKEGAHTAPRGELQQALCRIWSEVLDIEPVGIHDGFMDMGGNSLHAMRVVNRLRNQLGIELSMARLFEYPTIATLAEHIESMG